MNYSENAIVLFFFLHTYKVKQIHSHQEISTLDRKKCYKSNRDHGFPFRSLFFLLVMLYEGITLIKLNSGLLASCPLNFTLRALLKWEFGIFFSFSFLFFLSFFPPKYKMMCFHHRKFYASYNTWPVYLVVGGLQLSLVSTEESSSIPLKLLREKEPLEEKPYG